VIDSPVSAVVKTRYLIRDFQYLFLDIAFAPKSAAHTIDKGAGVYTFKSVPLDYQLSFGDPNRYKVIRQEFHRRNDINTEIKAASLEAACDEFFGSFEDTYEIVTEKKDVPKEKAPMRSIRQH
jgi:hypothetical protein